MGFRKTALLRMVSLMCSTSTTRLWIKHIWRRGSIQCMHISCTFGQPHWATMSTYVKWTIFSTQLTLPSYFCPSQKVLIHGALRKGGHGCPTCVFEESLRGKKAIAAHGTVEIVVFKGDLSFFYLIVGSCYDQKPFYMMIHSIEHITWVPVVKLV